MNYYERYCGDYSRDTAHLSLIEHGAYTLMLDTYYSAEAPLAADYGTLYRLCRAMSKPEQVAVRTIADRFFPVLDDGLRHNRRADAVIASARKRIDIAKANGRKGGRSHNPAAPPAGNPAGNPAGSYEEPGGHHMVKPPAPAPTTPKGASGEGLQTPHGYGPAAEWPKTLSQQTWECWRKHLLCKGKPLTPPQEALQLARLREHADPEQIVADAIAAGHVNLAPIGGWPSQQPRTKSQADTRAETAAAIFGDGANRDETAIDGTAQRVA